MCGALRVLFEETGHRVTTTPSIVATVDAVLVGDVDLLLLDLGLADGDGREVLAALTAQRAMPRVVVALTGRDEPEIVEACRAAGCRDVLLKPVPSRQLLALVGAWAEEAASARGARAGSAPSRSEPSL